MKNTIHFLILGTSLSVALFLRLYALDEAPPGLNRDEAAIGYTAYSLLKTGRDEYGVFLPLQLKSFGDWKLPAYVYATVPFVAVLGLTEIAVRLPSVIAGMLTIVLTYMIALKLFENRQLALLSALVMAVTPWHVFFSRVASESNLAVLFVTTAVYFFLMSQKKHRYLLPGFAFLGLSLVTYHGNHVFTPLFFITLCIYFRKNLQNPPGIIGFCLFILSALLIYGQAFISADRTKISGLLSLNDASLVYENIVQNRLIFPNVQFGKVLYNKATYFLENFTQNYLNSFSPEFLFIRGGGNMQHNIPDFGNLYIVDAPFLLLGLYYLFAHREKSARLLLLWILLAPMGAALTKDSPHSARSFGMFPAISLIVAYGINNLAGRLMSGNKKPVAVGIALLYFINISLWLPRYFVTFPYKRYAVWGNANKELVNKLAVRKFAYRQTVVSRPDYSPYIYYLFYQRSDPKNVQENLAHYPPTDEGFNHVRSYDGVTYKKIDWTDELIQPYRLYVDWVQDIPKGATQSSVFLTRDELLRLAKGGKDITDIKTGLWINSRVVDQVLLPDGKPLIYFIETFVGQEGSEKL